MATQLTIPEIISIGNSSLPFSLVDLYNGSLFNKSIATQKSCVEIAMFTDILSWGLEAYPTVSAASAVGYITIDTVGDDGDNIEVLCDIPNVGQVSFGNYTKQSSDTTTTILAASLTAALSYSGFTFTSNYNIITITAPLYLGSSINGGNNLSVVITPSIPLLLINSSDSLLINSTDKIII
jgi:hypothetical protein